MMKGEMNMLKKNKKNFVIALALIAIMAIGGIAAYFTSTDQATNTWTVGKIKIDLTEPQYDENNEEEAKNMTPNKEIHKDPQITNTGNNSAYVFMKVTIPKANVMVANQDGTRQQAEVQELFDYQWNDGWYVVSVDESEAKYNTYVVAYASKDACTSLAENAKTPVLFKNAAGNQIDTPNEVGIITFKNVIEGQGLEETVLTIDVKAFAIQTADLGTENVTSPSEVWSILSKQTNETTVSSLKDYFQFN